MASTENPDKQNGVVTKSTGSWYTVREPDGNAVQCKIKGTFRIKGIDSTNPVTVGDRVSFSQEQDGTGVIHNIEKRDNYIIRRATKLSKRTHIIAANIDQALLVVTLQEPETPKMFIDRFLVTAEAYHIPAAIIVNKTDLYTGKRKEELAEFKAIYKSAGYRLLEVSAVKNENSEPLVKLLKDKNSLIAGLSGVGKSTLINMVDERLELKVGEISDYHKTGKHTTTFAEMHELSFGGFIIDTPGIRSFGLADLKEELAHRFPEIRRVMDDCQFNNCLHINEPKCAVRVAVDNGIIPQSRYNNYVQMLEGDEDDPYRHNIHSK